MTFEINQDLAFFFQKNSPYLYPHETYRQYYYVGDQIKKEKESLPHYSLSQLISHFEQTLKTKLPSQKYSVEDHLFSFSLNQLNKGQQNASSSQEKIYCNFDPQLYMHDIYPLSPQLIEAQFFLYKSGQHIFMASTDQIPPYGPFEKTPVLQGRASKYKSAFCHYHNPELSSHILLFAHKNRDPAQHLIHLAKFGLTQSQSMENIDHFLKGPRHTILSRPPRIIIESNRTEQEVINTYLKSELPLYHHTSLGEIIGAAQMGSETNVFVDERHPQHLECFKE